MHKSFFNRVLQGVGVTGSTVAITDHKLLPQQIYKYTRIVFEDETTDITSVRFGIVHPSGFHVVFYATAPGVGVPVRMADSDVIISSPEQLEVRVIGTVDADVMRLYLSGYLVDPLKSG